MSLLYDEMKDQYNAMAKSMACVDENLDAVRAFLEEAKPKRFIFAGCGSSYSIAKSIADMTNMRTGYTAFSVAAGDVGVNAARYKTMADGAVIVPITRSGSTSELFLMKDELEKAGAAFSVLGIAGVVDSPLRARSGCILEMPWCYDRSVCQTRTVSCLYVTSAYLMMRLSGNDAVAEELKAFPESGRQYMEAHEAEWKAIAEEGWDHAVVLGDAETYGLIEEGALAYREICQLPSNSYHILDLRHGPMVLLSEKTLAIVCMGDTKQEADLVEDVVAKGARTLVCTELPKELPGTTNFALGFACDPIVRALGTIVVCQMTAFYKSFVCGTNPDRPTGLDAWIKLK